MSAPDWSRVVFRLSNIPSGVTDKVEAANLVAAALGLHSNHVAVCSLARTSSFWALEPSRVATLQLESVPTVVQNAPSEKEWSFPLPNGAPGEHLLLDTHFNGMTVLNDVEASMHRADCIAISGLASHPFGSWQPRGRDKGFMWIRDSIPKAIPYVRTVIYGYDSELVGSSSIQSISEIAQTLILRLRSGGWNSPSSKPIIFLAHSLGGLVLKEAIVQIAEREKAIADILKNVLGVIMFGVPSLGMKQSSLMAMVKGQPNELLVHDLSREHGTSYIRELSTRFEGLAFLGTKKIFWAFETKESPTVMQRADGTWARTGPPAILVDPESATYYNYQNKSVTIPINQDHSNMVKFSRGDPDLDVILDVIADLCSLKRFERRETDLTNDFPSASQPSFGEKAYLSSLDGFDHSEEGKILRDHAYLMSSLGELFNTLQLPELGFRASQIETPFQDTFKWIFELPMFSKWLQEGTELFWIRGKPGSGKSTLMKLICESKETWELLHSLDTGLIEVQASFFFHYRGSAVQKSFEGLLRSLIVQILSPHLTGYRNQHQTVTDAYQIYQYIRDKRQSIRTELEANGRAIAKAEASESLLDIARGAGEVSKELSHLRGELGRMKKQRKSLETELHGWETRLGDTQQSLIPLAISFKPHIQSPTTLFLTALVAEFRKEGVGLIPKLEKILRLLLDQNLTRVNLVLFFDALDEFDGHIGLIGRFLENLVQPAATSLTRVKACFSSRPSEHLQARFSRYPGFELHDHTKQDIEEYAAGMLAGPDITDSPILQLVPRVLSRADGVFLWVRLTLNVLLETAATCQGEAPLELLEAKLKEVPDDLFEFYKLIIERISKPNRRKTFVLLELLNRLNGNITATQLRDAVLASGCNTYQEVIEELRKAHVTDEDELPYMPKPNSNEMRVRQDISTWGGGLVECKRHFNIDRPQLMHQTVLEFARRGEFKRIVLGNLAEVVGENGHSFHMKYWSTTLNWGHYNSTAINEAASADHVSVEPRHQQYSDLAGDEREAFGNVGFHAERSELTTGKSQYEFLHSMFQGSREQISLNQEADFVSLISSYGLNLCLRDWIKKAQSQHQGSRLSIFARFYTAWYTYFPIPIVEALVMTPPSGVFKKRYLATMQLLLENGYKLRQTEDFFSSFSRTTWEDRLYKKPVKFGSSLLPMLITLALESDIQPGISTDVCLAAGPAEITAIQIIRQGVNPNARDSNGRTLLDWVVHSPRTDDLEGRYALCCMLLERGGKLTEKTSTSAVTRALADFESQGHNVWDLLEGFKIMRPDCSWHGSNTPRREKNLWSKVKFGFSWKNRTD